MNKNVPLRRCVGCRNSFDKESLNRYVNIDGKSILDNDKKLAGRGIYVCKDKDSCLKKAIKKGKIYEG